MSISSSKPSALVASHVCPVPVGAGNELRIRQLLTWLHARGFAVNLLLTFAPTPEQRAALSAFCAGVYGPDDRVDVPRGWRRRVRMERLAMGGRFRRACEAVRAPRRVAQIPALYGHCTEAMRRQASRLAAAQPPDIAVAVYYFMTPIFQHCGWRPLRIVDTLDAYSLRGAKLAGTGIVEGSWITAGQEREALLRGDLIMAIQPEEAAYFRRLAPERPTITVGVDAPLPASWSAGGQADGAVLAVGSDNEGNCMDVERFAREAWPRVRAAVRGARLRIVGRVGAAVRVNDPLVEIAGWVPSLDEEYRRARVVVNPVSVGTGLKLKTIEALCHGKALVGTPSAFEGMDADGTPPWRVAGDMEGMVLETIALLTDAESRERLGRAARAYAEARYGADIVYRELAQALEASEP